MTLRCAAADASITFPVLAGGATQDSLTTIRDKVSGVMVWSGRMDSPPCRSAAELHFSERKGATGREADFDLHRQKRKGREERFSPVGLQGRNVGPRFAIASRGPVVHSLSRFSQTDSKVQIYNGNQTHTIDAIPCAL